MYDLDEILKRTMHGQYSFKLMLEHLNTIKNPLIVETGCARGNTPEGDGWSTIVFDLYCRRHGARAISIDITKDHVIWAQSQTTNVQIIHGDSVSTLNRLSDLDLTIDLLYLDSYDFTPGEEHNSALHHLMEFSAASKLLKKGALISVDDCFIIDGQRRGKGVYLQKYLQNLGKPILYDGYQMIWTW